MDESSAAAEPKPASPTLWTGPIDIRSVALTALLMLAVFHTMAVAASLLLPITLALLANLALSPLVRGLERLRIPAPVGAALVLAVVLGLVGLAVNLLAEPAAKWLDRAPASVREIDRKLRPVKEPLAQVMDATDRAEAVTKVEREEVAEVTVRAPSLAEKALSQATYALSAAAVVLVLLYFLLAGSDTFLRKIVHLLPRFTDKKRAIELVRRAENDISRYLLTITLVNLALGCIIALVTYLFGLPNPLLWGALACVLNFVPYLGAVVTAVVIAAVALLSFDDVARSLLVPLVCWGISAVEGAFVTPTLLGRRLLLSPVVVFVGLFVWGWLWGIAGALIAVPALVVLKITCDQTERLRPLGVLLGR